MKGGVGGEGKQTRSGGSVERGVAWWRGEGGTQNEEALSLMLYCTLSVIATQIRASHRNHLHTDQCAALRDDAPVITADLYVCLQQGARDTSSC